MNECWLVPSYSRGRRTRRRVASTAFVPLGILLAFSHNATLGSTMISNDGGQEHLLQSANVFVKQYSDHRRTTRNDVAQLSASHWD